jgi:WD40 repeat protein
MRLLRGGNVQSLLSQGPLTIETTTHLLEQICSALNTAHRIGVIHRDLKPANVLLDEDNNAYLADFGIAKNLGNPDLENQTQLDAIIGSPQYMSPEQIRSLSIRPQTDIYCLGVMLYEMLTGALPFSGPTPFDFIQQHINTPMPPLSTNRAGLPAALDAVIARATAKDPDVRYADTLSLFSDFQRAVGRIVASQTVNFEYEEEESNLETSNPFKGLRAFSEADSENFFGRETLVQQLLARLGEGGDLSRFLAVIGPSGSGKSSVVRAGLIPALRRGGLPGSENWFIVDMLPGKHPFEELEASLLRVAVNPPASLLSQLKDGARGLLRAVHRILPADESVELVLVIDQFEEVFTLVEEETERALLLESLATAVLDEHSRLRVVITLRADFTDKPLRYTDFGEIMNRRFEFVLPLTADEVERVIVGPAQHVGLKLEKGLVPTIIREAGNQPGALPLLQYALSELFEKREGRTLTNQVYREIGGVLGALGRSAESIYANLDEIGQSTTRQLFLRLVTLGEGTEDTRRRVLRTELENLTIENSHNRLSEIINLFGNARLLTFDHDPITRGATIEIAHEALLREWERFGEWLYESRADVRFQRQLATAASEWGQAREDVSFLLMGARLEQFDGWAADTTVALTQDERAFLHASLGERDRRQTEERARQQRELEAAQKLAQTERARAEEQTQSANRLRIRNRVITTVGSIAVILAILASMFASQANQNAVTAQNNAATAQVAKDNAVNAQATTQTMGDLASKAATISFSRELAAQAQLNLTIDPERSILLAIAGLNKAHTSEAEYALHEAVSASRVRLTLRGHKGPVDGVAYSPDGTLIASAGRDGTARLWDATTGKQLFNLQHPTDVKLVLFSPDGTHLITGANDGIVRIWDVTSGKQLLKIIATQAILYAGPGDLSVVISPDGKLLATTGGNEPSVKFWDLNSGTEIFALDSPDWRNVISGTDINPHGLAFSPDGIHMAISLIGNAMGRIEIWDVTTHQRVQTLEGSFDPGYPSAFSPDGKRLASALGPDGNADIWDIASGKILFNLVVSLNDIHFSADGKHVFGAGHGGFFQVFDAETGNELLNLSADIGRTIISAGSPECVHPPVATFDWCSPRLAVVGDGDVIKIWDISPTGKQEFLTLPGENYALSADGTRLGTVTYDPFPPEPGATVTFQQWSLPTGLQFDGTTSYRSSSFQLDDHIRDWFFFTQAGILAMDFDNGPVKFWDATQNGKTIYPISCCTWKDGMVLAFSSRDHPRLAIGDISTGAVLIWDLVADAKIQLVQVAKPNDPTWPGLYWFYFNPDGQHLVTIRNDAITETWDVTTGKKLLTMPGPNIVDRSNLYFSSDGKFLVISDCGGTSVVRDAATGAEIQRFSTGTCSNGAAFSADDQLMVLSSPNMKIWNLETGQAVVTLPAQGWEPQFTPDGKRLVTYLEGEELTLMTVDVYLLQLDDLVALAKNRVTRSLTSDECQEYLHMDMCPASP